MDNQNNNYGQYRRNINEENKSQNHDYINPNRNNNYQNQTSHYQQRMQYGRNGQEQYQRRNRRQYFHRNQENIQENYNQDHNNYQYRQENYNHQINNDQQGKMIKNPKSNITQNKNQEMDDQDFLNDILATEKYLSDGYNTFLLESSHTELHTDVKQILNETHDCAREIFNLMFENGFYSLQTASPQEIQKAQDTFSNYLNQQSPYGNKSDLL